MRRDALLAVMVLALVCGGLVQWTRARPTADAPAKGED